MSVWTDHATDLPSGRTGWREAGEGPPLLFLHGLGGTRSSWNPQLAYFATTRRCIAWDMPGYGDSTCPAALTYAYIADRLVELLDHLHIDRADMVGLSFGGMHILHTALRHPDRVGAIVLADTSPAFGMNGTRAEDWKAARLGPLDAGETVASMAPKVLDAIIAKPVDPALRDQFIEGFSRISAEGLRSAVECLPHNDVRADLPSIEHRALVITGELDEETPVEYAQVLADGLPNASIEILPSIGHLSPIEAPELFNARVSHFLNEHVDDSGAPL